MPKNEDAPHQKFKVLSPPPAAERGPTDRVKLSEAFPDPTAPPDPFEPTPDFGILNHVIGRLIKRGPFSEPILALEILDGPYKGIVFSYAQFTMLPARMDNGMIPTRYETEIHIVPNDLQDTFVKDEAFDTFTSEIVIAWLGFLHTNDLAPLLKIKATGIQ